MSAEQFLEDAKGKLLWAASSRDWSAYVTPRECEALLAHIQMLEALVAVPVTGTIDRRENNHEFYRGEGDEQTDLTCAFPECDGFTAETRQEMRLHQLGAHGNVA